MQRRLHETHPHYGTNSGRWAVAVRTWAKRLGAGSILDYGCGKQELSRALLDLPIRGYDPALADLAVAAPADLVVCSDVMEHVEPECIDDVLDHIASLARIGVFFTIAQLHSLKTLEDGRNAHLTQEGMGWWLPKIEARWKVMTANERGADLIVVARA